MQVHKRNWQLAVIRGFTKQCPACGDGPLFSGFMTTHDACRICGTDFHHHRADDAPPYFTIMVVGHIVVPALLVVERLWHPELWLHFIVWLPLTLLLTLWLLPRVKGAVIGLQWALRMHGFAAEPEAQNLTLQANSGLSPPNPASE